MDANTTYLIITAITVGVYLGSIFFLLKFYAERQSKRKNKSAFYRALKSGLNSNSLGSLNDIVNLYRGISGEGLDDLSYHRDLIILLRDFLVDLVSRNKNFEKEDADLKIEFIDGKRIPEWKPKIDVFISELERLSPYADIPDAERYLLNDLSTSLTDENNKKR